MVKNEIILATRNDDKLAELQTIFNFEGLKIKSLSSFDNIEEVEEDGETFEENAIKKALGYASQTNGLTLADDSGLCVDFLDGAPGIYSSRYAGEEKDSEKNCQKILDELKGCPVEKRTAFFITAIAIAEPGRVIDVVTGVCHGRIIDEKRGEKGFGYDPIFYHDGLSATFAELEPKQKNQVSHRFKALEKAKKVLASYLESV